VLVIAVLVATRLWTDLLFFRSVNASRVFSTVRGTRTFLFVVFGLVMALAVGANIVVAFRLRPPFRPMSLEQQNLERYRVSVEPYLALLLVAVCGACGVLAGLSAAGRWQTWLSWRHGQQFGQRDAQFHRDISYFAFTYPFQRFVLGFAFTVLVLSLLAAAATHYLCGGIRLQTRGEKVVAAAKAHLSVLLALFMLRKTGAAGEDAAQSLRGPGIDVEPVHLDLTDASSIDAALKDIEKSHEVKDGAAGSPGRRSAMVVRTAPRTRSQIRTRPAGVHSAARRPKSLVGGCDSRSWPPGVRRTSPAVTAFEAFRR